MLLLEKERTNAAKPTVVPVPENWDSFFSLHKPLLRKLLLEHYPIDLFPVSQEQLAFKDKSHVPTSSHLQRKQA